MATVKKVQGAVPRLRFPPFGSAWAEKRVGDIAHIHKGKGIAKSDITSDGAYPCIRYGELYTTYGEVITDVISRTSVPINALVFSEPNDVLIPSSGETKEDIATAACVVPGGIALGGDLNVLRSQENGIFLSYYLNGPLKAEIARVAQGNAVVHLYPHQIEKLRMAVPSGDEQKAIADCLSSLDECMNAEICKLDTLKTHKQGLIQQMFPAEGQRLPHVRFPGFNEQWEEVALSTKIELISGQHLAPDAYAKAGEVPYFTGPSDFSNDLASVGKWTSLSANTGRLGDTLITVKGSGVGELLYLDLEEVAMGRQLMAIRPQTADSRFLFQFLSAQRRLLIALATGNLIPGLSRGDILSLKIKIPSQIEQKKIGDFLSSIDDIIDSNSRKIAALQQHKKGLMQGLFPAMEVVAP